MMTQCTITRVGEGRRWWQSCLGLTKAKGGGLLWLNQTAEKEDDMEARDLRE
jgi:hypothetical protein